MALTTRARPRAKPENPDNAAPASADLATGAAAPFVPALPARPRDRGEALGVVASAARACRGCPLYANATQTVFGAGPVSASIMLVGEQPGDREDKAGAPFVGPAGAVFDAALAAAGIPRSAVYVTNAVKHFSFVPRGKLRLHQKPKTSEVRACRPWLAAEIALVRPRIIVALGSTATEALAGPRRQVTKDRGQALATPLAEALVLTYHPSAVLRGADAAAREAVRAALVEDLSLAWQLARRTRRAAGVR